MLYAAIAVALSLILIARLRPTTATTLGIPNGVRLEISCNGTQEDTPSWFVNGIALLSSNEELFLKDGIQRKEGSNDGGYLYNTLCIDVRRKHHGYSLQCRVGEDTVFSIILNIKARLPPPENVDIFHSSNEVHLKWSHPVYETNLIKNVTINVYLNITHYTIYVGNLNTRTVTSYKTADNNTEFTVTNFTLPEIPGEDLNECTEYEFEVAATNARAGEGLKSAPQHLSIPKGCLTSTPPNTFTSEKPPDDNAIEVGPVIGGVIAASVVLVLCPVIAAVAIVCIVKKCRPQVQNSNFSPLAEIKKEVVSP